MCKTLQSHLLKVKTAMGFDRGRSASLMEAKLDDICRCVKTAKEGTKSAGTPRHCVSARPKVCQQLHSFSPTSPTSLFCFEFMSALESNHCDYAWSKTTDPVSVFVLVSEQSISKWFRRHCRTALQITARTLLAVTEQSRTCINRLLRSQTQ